MAKINEVIRPLKPIKKSIKPKKYKFITYIKTIIKIKFTKIFKDRKNKILDL